MKVINFKETKAIYFEDRKAFIHPSNVNLCFFIELIKERVKTDIYIVGIPTIKKTYEADFYGGFMIESYNIRATIKEIKERLKQFLSTLDTYKPTRYYSVETVIFYDRYGGSNYSTIAMYDHQNRCIFATDDHTDPYDYADQFSKDGECPNIQYFTKYCDYNQTKRYHLIFQKKCGKIFKCGKKLLIADAYALDGLRGLLDKDGNYKTMS